MLNGTCPLMTIAMQQAHNCVGINCAWAIVKNGVYKGCAVVEIAQNSQQDSNNKNK